jgi:hypothetical protein
MVGLRREPILKTMKKIETANNKEAINSLTLFSSVEFTSKRLIGVLITTSFFYINLSEEHPLKENVLKLLREKQSRDVNVICVIPIQPTKIPRYKEQALY